MGHPPPETLQNYRSSMAQRVAKRYTYLQILHICAMAALLLLCFHCNHCDCHKKIEFHLLAFWQYKTQVTLKRPQYLITPPRPSTSKVKTLSSISLPIERAPPLSNSLHTIYSPWYLYIVLIFCMIVLVLCMIVLIFCNLSSILVV